MDSKPSNEVLAEKNSPNKASQKETAMRLLQLSRPEFLRILFGIAGLLTNSVTNLSFPWCVFIFNIIDSDILIVHLFFYRMMGKAIDIAGKCDDSCLMTFGPITGTKEYFTFVAGAAGVFMCGSLASWVRLYCLGNVEFFILVFSVAIVSRT